MQTFDQSLHQLYQSGRITIEEALRNATNVDEFRMRTAGILSSTDQAVVDRKNIVSVSPAQASNTRAEAGEAS
jgi:Tfp pilus assembly ATPase PilU